MFDDIGAVKKILIIWELGASALGNGHRALGIGEPVGWALGIGHW